MCVPHLHFQAACIRVVVVDGFNDGCKLEKDRIKPTSGVHGARTSGKTSGSFECVARAM